LPSDSKLLNQNDDLNFDVSHFKGLKGKKKIVCQILLVVMINLKHKVLKKSLVSKF
jgi:hypothetical protein